MHPKCTRLWVQIGVISDPNAPEFTTQIGLHNGVMWTPFVTQMWGEMGCNYDPNVGPFAPQIGCNSDPIAAQK